MQLEDLWEKYGSYGPFNISSLPEHIRNQGVKITYPPRSVILSRGEFPKYIYFIETGIALGTRDYNDGNNYYYFQISIQFSSLTFVLFKQNYHLLILSGSHFGYRSIKKETHFPNRKCISFSLLIFPAGGCKSRENSVPALSRSSSPVPQSGPC